MTFANNKSDPLGFRIASGQRGDLESVHKFGHNNSLPTSFAPICNGGVWRTPQVSGATQLRVKAGGNANDTAAGSGAREITLVGVDATGAEITDILITAGTSASSPTTKSFIRVYRAWVSSSGTYATSAAGSHAADITLEDSGGTEDWMTIGFVGFAQGQSQIGVYTVPLGKVAYINQFQIDPDTNKTVDIILFQRQNILETSAPYTAMRVVQEFVGLSNTLMGNFDVPLGPFPALTDIGFMGKGATSPAVSVDFSIILEDA